MTLTPKANFLKSSKDAVSSHARAVESLLLTRAGEIALLQYTMNLQSANMEQAAANHYRAEGARAVLNVLLSLHEPMQTPKPHQSHNLSPV
jgi:hypothetical protein